MKSRLTFVIVLAILAVFLQLKRAVDSIPAVVAATLEETFAADTTLTVTRTAVGQEKPLNRFISLNCHRLTRPDIPRACNAFHSTR